MKGIADALSACSQCGICQSVCPVFRVTGRESDGPRGKIAILRALANGSLTAREASPSIRRCVLCGACSRVCPSDVPASRAFELARELLPKSRRNAREAVFNFLAARPRLWNALQNPLFQIWRVREYLPPPLDRLGNSFAAPREKISPLNPAAKEGEKRVLLWPGCLTSRFLPGVLEACLDSLTGAGFVPVLLADLPCCGRPALVAGDRKKIRSLALEGLNILRKYEFDYLATPCPGCLATIREVWPQVFEEEGEPKKMARDIASRAMSIDALLRQYVTTPDVSEEIAWHAPCLTRERMGEDAWATDAPQKSIEGCCGACLPSSEAELGRDLGQNCRDLLRATGKKSFVSSCPACAATLKRVMRENNDRTDIRHSIEILADSLRMKAEEETGKTANENKKSPDAKTTGDNKRE